MPIIDSDIKPLKYNFQDSFEESLLARLLRSKEFYFKYGNFIKVEYLESQIRRDILVLIQAYYSKYSEPISREILTNEILTFLQPRIKKAEKMKNGPELVRQEYDMVVERLYSLDISMGEAYTVDKIVTFARNQRYRGFVANTVEDLQSGKGEPDLLKVSAEISDIRQIGNELDLGYDYFGETVERTSSFRHEDRVQVKTGFRRLDRALGGGLAAGELGLILGPPSRGKTACMVNLAFGALLNRKNVIVFGLEGTRMDLATRFDMRIARVEKKEIEVEFQKIQDSVTYFSTLAKKKLILKMYPMESVGCSDLENFLDFKESSEGWKPEVIFIDYFNLLKRYAKEEPWVAAARKYREGKSLAVRRNLPVWSGVQANMGSLKKINISPNDIAEAPGRIWADADVIIGLCQTDEEKEMNPMEMKWRLGKNRNNESRLTLPIIFTSKHMLMEENMNVVPEGEPPSSQVVVQEAI